MNLMVFQMFMWSALVRLVSCIILLFWVLGVSAISGLSLVFLSLPLNKVGALVHPATCAVSLPVCYSFGVGVGVAF